MNEKIQELFEQVADNLDPEDCMVSEEFLEAFTELIVQECIKQVDLSSECFTAEQVHIKSLATNSIKQHFGVKE